MAVIHLLPISAAKISLCVQISEAICLLPTIIMVRKLSLFLFPGSNIAEYVPALLTASYIPLLNWSLQGMKVGPFALIVVWSVWIALREVKVKLARRAARDFFLPHDSLV